MGSDNCPNGNIINIKELKLKTQNEKSKDFFICSDCGKELKSKSELKQHINSKCGTMRLFKCKVCGQDLMTAGSLHNHMLRHNGDRSFMCRFCAKMFLTAGQLKVHERIHTQEKVYICQVCGKGFCHRQSLCTHTTIHTGIKPYQCENCGNAFSCIGNLIKHRKTHADTCALTPLITHRVIHPSTKQKVRINTPASTKLKQDKINKSDYSSDNELQLDLNELNKIPSETTNKKTPTNQATKIQIEEVISVNEHNVEQKKKLITSKTGVVIVPKQSNEQIKCSVNNEFQSVTVSATFTVASDCNNYQDTFTDTDENKDSDTVQELKPKLKDDVSSKINDIEDNSNNNENNRKKQIDSVIDEENCVEEFLSQEVHPMQQSAKNFRKRKKGDSQEYKQFINNRNLGSKKNESCLYCSKLYTNFKWLFKHEQEHKKIITQNTDVENGEIIHRLHKCSCCKMRFSTKADCKNHQIKSHADLLTCAECERIFANIDSLRSHQNTCHKGVPRKLYLYICKQCGFQFKQKAQLLLHEKYNCEEGPHIVCEICNKQFTSIHTRQAHMKVHNPEKKLVCKYCNKSFHWKGQLKIHERSHTGEKPFTCLYCPRAFAYRESLMTHSSLHTGIKPYLCEACGWRFSCIGNLIKHRNTHASTCGVWFSRNQQGKA